MDAFYEQLFRPVAEKLGPPDPATLTAVVGFTAGGPVSMKVFGHSVYVTCELARRKEQLASSTGRYEVMLRSDDRTFARELLTNVAAMSFDARFDDGHTLDIAPWVGRRHAVQGVRFERFCTVMIGKRPYSILELHGLSRRELPRC